jgi:polyisoprenoid-binding protein YceI
MTSQPRIGRRPVLALLAVAAVVAIAAAAGIWYLFFRPAGPAPVSLGTLPPASALAESSAGTGGGTEPGAIDGTWTVDTSIGSLDDGSGTFVGYRVQEQLATIGATEAVGRTTSVTGTMSIDGTSVIDAELTADLTTLRSDESNRDRQLSRQALETGRYPTATFTLTQPIDLGSSPSEGVVVDATATGDLTLHGVTRSVNVPLQARIDGDVITVAGSLPITFADWSIEAPRAMVVLSVADQGTMELQLHFTRGT